MELLLNFLDHLKNGQNYQVPVYSHEIYDIVPDQTQTIQVADFVIVEGDVYKRQLLLPNSASDKH